MRFSAAILLEILSVSIIDDSLADDVKERAASVSY